MPPLFTPAPKNGRSVGVIGGGPAGLACAAELAILGYAVTIYEGKPTAGGLDTWGIAPYKMRFQDSLNEIRLVESFGVTIRTNIWVGRTVSIEELERQHDAIFISIGLGQSPDLNVPGEELPGVVEALEFIEKVTRREWSSVDVGRRVAVIGAGNTAIDAVTEAKRLGAEKVMILYRRSEAEMSAYDFEYELAKSDGVNFHFLTAPKRILGSTHVEGIECVKMELGPPDSRGRRIATPVPGTEFVLPVDMVIKAIGQKTSETLFSRIPGLTLTHGTIAVHPETLQTANPKYFAGGDCVNGGKEVVNAAADGKRAAHGIDSSLTR
jgi:glutamate synthase (NADPH/NADH) small chain